LETHSQIIAAGLYIVATPIGNLRDITIRALDVLKAADLILCEDTRTSGKLLAYYGIKAHKISYHEHNHDEKIGYILEQLHLGKKLALISDAGTPLISDPGYRLVREVSQAGIAVFPIPGASSAITALCASGLATQRFLFAGFLPAKAMARQKIIRELLPVTATLVFFESVHRIIDTLSVFVQEFGAEREAVVARELTKLHEEIRRGTLAELLAYFVAKETLKGEFVILVSAPPEMLGTEVDIEALIREKLGSMSVKDCAAEISKQLDIPKKEIYERALRVKDS